MLLSAAFLRASAEWTVPRRVLNISSGLGRRAMASQAGYCAAKAGMDHFTRCLALEQQALPNGARVCSLAPGVIDTEANAGVDPKVMGMGPVQASRRCLERAGWSVGAPTPVAAPGQKTMRERPRSRSIDGTMRIGSRRYAVSVSAAATAAIVVGISSSPMP